MNGNNHFALTPINKAEQIYIICHIFQVDLLIGHNVSNVAVISPDSSVSTFTVEYSMLENAPADPTAWTTHSDTLAVRMIARY